MAFGIDGPDGERVGSDGSAAANEFVRLYVTVCQQERSALAAWCERLQRDGVRAAHPIDGWVNRERGVLRPVNLYFSGRVEAGDVIALGDPASYRLVRLVQLSGSWLTGPVWHFEEYSDGFK